jgi:hypothetical protein
VLLVLLTVDRDNSAVLMLDRVIVIRINGVGDLKFIATKRRGSYPYLLSEMNAAKMGTSPEPTGQIRIIGGGGDNLYSRFRLFGLN